MMQDKLQDLRAKHNLSETDHQQIFLQLVQMQNFRVSISQNKLREEHNRLRRVLKFLTRDNEALQADVLYLLWETMRETKHRRTDERRERRSAKPRTDAQGVIEI